MRRVFVLLMLIFWLSSCSESGHEESDLAISDAAVEYREAPVTAEPLQVSNPTLHKTFCVVDGVDVCRTICYVVKVLSEMEFMGGLDYAQHPCFFYESELRDE